MRQPPIVDAEYVATGAIRRGPYKAANDGAIPGADASRPNVLTPQQIMLEGKPVPGKTVAVLDYGGYVAGLG